MEDNSLSGKQDTALQFDGRGLNAFKRLDASAKAGRASNVKPHQQQEASLVQLETPDPKKAVENLEAAWKKHIDEVPGEKQPKLIKDVDPSFVTGEVEKIKAATAQGMEPLQATAATTIDKKYKDHRTEAATGWTSEITAMKAKLDAEHTVFPEPNKGVGEKEMNLHYRDFMAAISTFKPERLTEVQETSGAMMLANAAANKESKEYASRMEALAGNTGEGYTKMGLNHFYGYDQIMGQIEEGHMVPGKAIHIFLPVDNKVTFNWGRNTLCDESIAYLTGAAVTAGSSTNGAMDCNNGAEKPTDGGLKKVIEDKVAEYKGFHFTFCVEASTPLDKATATVSNKILNGKRPFQGQENQTDLVKIRQETLDGQITGMLTSLSGNASNTFHVVQSKARDEHYNSFGSASLPVAAVLMIAEDKDHRDYPEGERDKNCNEHRAHKFDVIAGGPQVMTVIRDLTLNSGSTETPVEAGANTNPQKFDQAAFDCAYTALLKIEEDCHKEPGCKASRKLTDVTKCLALVKEHNEGSGASETFKGIGTAEFKPTSQFTDYMDEQMAYFCNVLSGMHEVKDPIAVVAASKDEPVVPP